MEDPKQQIERGTLMGGEMVAGRALLQPERPPCKHDSIRLDCWVDTHCLRCGEPGYWVDGELIAENSVDAIAKGHVTRGHPCGKTLISQGMTADAEARSVEEEAEHWRKVGHPAPWENDAV